jgi:hypothetical protein
MTTPPASSNPTFADPQRARRSAATRRTCGHPGSDRTRSASLTTASECAETEISHAGLSHAEPSARSLWPAPRQERPPIDPDHSLAGWVSNRGTLTAALNSTYRWLPFRVLGQGTEELRAVEHELDPRWSEIRQHVVAGSQRPGVPALGAGSSRSRQRRTNLVESSYQTWRALWLEVAAPPGPSL